MTFDFPRPFGRYELLRRVAIGGMGEVFEARGRDDDRRYAIKLLLPQHAQDPRHVQMLADEARLNVALSHANLVRVFELDVVQGQPYLAMEFVHGTDLHCLIGFCRDGCSLPPEVAVYIVAQLLEGLAYVHEATDAAGNDLNIVHRDVSPHNVLLGTHGEVKLGDFGIARSAVREMKTETGMIRGKLRYLAPEQATASALGSGTDLYLVGLILFELLAGEPFLQPDNEVELLKAAAEPTPRLPSECVGHVTPELDQVVQHALQRFAEQRFASARAFADALAKAAGPVDAVRAARRLGALVTQVQDAPPPVLNVPAPIHRQPTLGTVKMPAAASRRFDTTRLAVVVVLGILLGVAVGALGGGLGWVVRESWFGSPRERSTGATATTRVPTDAPPTAAPIGAPLADGPSTAPRSIVPPSPVSLSPVPPSPVRRTPIDGLPSSDSSGPGTLEASSSTAGKAELPTAPPSDRRYKQLLARLASRGLVPADLAEADQAELLALPQLLAARDPGAAAAVAVIERAVAAVTIDGPFVEHKLRRVSTQLDAAKRRPGFDRAIDELVPVALRHYVAGRYGEANGTLTEIHRRLRQPTQSAEHTPVSAPQVYPSRQEPSPP